jgi:hypothetical protein
MQALETSIESNREVPTSLLRENAPGLATVVSPYLPMFYKRAFRYSRNAGVLLAWPSFELRPH